MTADGDDRGPDQDRGGSRVHVGSRVLEQEDGGREEYTIVPRGAADVMRGRISETSPVGRALIGRRIGDELTVQTPGGLRVLTVVDVEEGTPVSPPALWDWQE
jgi:transcription elongation factor GreA